MFLIFKACKLRKGLPCRNATLVIFSNNIINLYQTRIITFNQSLMALRLTKKRLYFLLDVGIYGEYTPNSICQKLWRRDNKSQRWRLCFPYGIHCLAIQSSSEYSMVSIIKSVYLRLIIYNLSKLSIISQKLSIIIIYLYLVQNQDILGSLLIFLYNLSLLSQNTKHK